MMYCLVHLAVSLSMMGCMALVVAGPLPAPGTPGAPADSRYCGEPARNARGEILRSTGAVNRFKQVWPMPNDGYEWHVDHVIPLASGGCDMGHNLQWLPTGIKSCAGSLCKDRWERRVYGVKP